MCGRQAFKINMQVVKSSQGTFSQSKGYRWKPAQNTSEDMVTEMIMVQNSNRSSRTPQRFVEEKAFSTLFVPL